MAIAADGEADAEAVNGHLADAKTPPTITSDDKAPSTTVAGDKITVTGADTEDLVRGDAIYDTSDVASDSSFHESPSGVRPPARERDSVDDDRSGSAMIRSGGPRVTRPSDEGSDLIGARVCFISILFLACSPPLLRRRHSGEPLAHLWRIALLMSAYLFFLISILSRTMRPTTVFVHISYGVLLAISAGTFAGPIAGFAVMHLATGWTAGLLGYAFAEHLQHIGMETTAMRMAPPTFSTEEEKSSFEIYRSGVVTFFAVFSMLGATAMALLVKVPPRDLSLLVINLSVLEGTAIYCWAVFVAKFALFEALVTVDQLGYMMFYIGAYLLVSFLVCLMSYLVLAGDAIVGAMFFWFLMMATAGLIGYMLSVRAQYNQMMAIAADGEGDAEVDAKTPSIITEDFLPGDAINDTTDVASDSSSPDDNPSDIRPPSRDSDGDRSGSAMISPASRSGRGRRVTTVYNGGSNRIRARIILISVPFLVCSTPLLRRHSGDPLALLWTIALLMCTHLFFLISNLSRTMRPSTVFFRISYGVLVAIAADTFAGPDAGFAVMHLATGWTAGLLGYAYAEHLQHIGKETTAKNMVPPTFLTEEESSFKVHRRSVAAFFTLLSLAVATAGALLVKMPPPALSLLVTILSILEGIAIYCWAIFTAKFLLFEAFVSVHQLGYMLCYIGPYLLLSSILCVPLSCLVMAGDAIGAMLFWFVMMAMAGLLGYMLSVRVQYNKMVLSRLPVEQSRDEDGLQQVWS
uniref:Transmembrane protein n=1 Tax=Oryza meridionalis TaxID=40149 RepID=A0A0E0CA65_9ORYZ